jgi:hypothetical protein
MNNTRVEQGQSWLYTDGADSLLEDALLECGVRTVDVGGEDGRRE